MKKFMEYLIVFLITYSIIELLTIVLTSFNYSYASVTSFEAVINSRLLIIELALSGLVSIVYNKVIKK